MKRVFSSLFLVFLALVLMAGCDLAAESGTTRPTVTNPANTQVTLTTPSVTEPTATEPSITEPSVTEPSVTEPPTTEPAVTEPSVTEPTAMEPSVTEPPTTEPTVTEPPTTEPSVTEPPVTEPPVTEPPTTESPVTEPPVTEPPVTEPPATEPPVTEPPTTEPTVTEPTITEPPVTEPPTTEPPTTEPPVTEPPVTEPPTTEPTVTEPPVTEPPATEPEPVELSAHVNGSFLVGDTLERSDFTITVTMSDGSVLTDPPGWTASTMELTSTSNKITVRYDGLKTTVTVPAEPAPIDGMDLVRDALDHLYLPYVLGGNSLTEGADCSGFTKLIFAKYGITLPRTAHDQHKVGTIIPAEEAKPGDLLAETYPEDHYYTGHAGIYLGGGKMVSAMPGNGVIITDVHSGMDYIRVYDNCYGGTDTDAYFECVEYCISLGHTGTYERCSVNWQEDGTATFRGVGPLGNLDSYQLRLELYNVTPGFESLLEAWKAQHIATSYISIYGERDPETYFTEVYAYWQGQWHLGSELLRKVEAGEITDILYQQTIRFYGAFWNSNATITNGLGEVVDLSTCPAIASYTTIAKPGDPDEGKASRIPYTPEGPDPCRLRHSWRYEDFEGGRIRTCRYCGYSLKDYDAVLEHVHEYERTIYRPTWIEEGDLGPSVIYSCLGCGDEYYVPLDDITGEDHDHDYSYLEYTVEPTCSMDGYDYHACDCGVSYKDQIVESPGHRYGEWETTLPTEDSKGYDHRTCQDCGHTQKDHYTEVTP